MTPQSQSYQNMSDSWGWWTSATVMTFSLAVSERWWKDKKTKQNKNKHLKKPKNKKHTKKTYHVFFVFRNVPWTQDLTTVSQKKNKKKHFKKQKNRKTTTKNIPLFFLLGGAGFPKCALDSGFDDSLAKKNKKNTSKNQKPEKHKKYCDISTFQHRNLRHSTRFQKAQFHPVQATRFQNQHSWNADFQIDSY